MVDGSRKHSKFSVAILPALGLTTLLFFATIFYFLFIRIPEIRDGRAISVMDYSPGSKLYGDLRTITISNMYPEAIELYFDDNEAGVYMTNMHPFENTEIRASSGHIFYATGRDSVERLATITIRDSVDKYTIQPARRMPFPRNEKVKYKLGMKEVDRKHPQVVLTNSRSFAMDAKFKSLSNRMLDLWFEDGRGGLYNGHLQPGQVTTTNTYVGHTFFVTAHGKKNEEIARFSIRADKVLYEIRDKGHDAPKHVLDQFDREIAFMEEYYNRTGIHWRHYFGRSGPRPPPVLYMWPAEKIGQVHYVESPESYW
jgi:hypothetical protein